MDPDNNISDNDCDNIIVPSKIKSETDKKPNSIAVFYIGELIHIKIYSLGDGII